MSELNKNKTRKPRQKLSKSALVLIISGLIIAIPVTIFLAILGISALQTGSPREGSRFDNDLEPAITSAQISTLKADLETIPQLQEVEVVLSQGQLKIFLDTDDSLSSEQIDSILTTAYGKVNAQLPVGTYFTATGTTKMYDLQINAYTVLDASPIGAEDSREYKLLHKNSSEDNYGIDDLAHPKNPSLAAELEGLGDASAEVETPEGESSEDEGE